MTTPEIPDFDLIRPIGSGGFGEVWLATNRTTGHLRAVKLIPLQQTGRSNPAAREIGSLTRLEANLRCHHPNLLPIHHVGKTANHLFYVMDPADDISGHPASEDPTYRPATLQTRLQNEGGKGDRRHLPERPEGCFAQMAPVPFSPLPPGVCLDYARQLLAGLAALHTAGMVHRDVKPANCLFVGGQLKLADFGLLTEAHPLVSRVGTQKYMPPDGRMDMRADVFAAGLVIYGIVTGLPVDAFPRLGRRAGELATNAILTKLIGVILRACEREPEQRYADARTMLAELEKPVETKHRWSRRRVLAAAAVVLAVVGLGAWTLTPAECVSVSFITDPYEATIYLDGECQVDSEGTPYRTPCTIDDLPVGTFRVAFQCDDQPRWESGPRDFAKTRQIVSRRPR